MSSVKRVYVEKKQDFAVQAKELRSEIEGYLGIKDVTGVRVLIRYDVENISDEVFEKACTCVFSEPPVDDLFRETFEMAEGAKAFSVEYLPGQFDQRADSAVQCVQFLKEDENPIIRSATTYVIEGNISDEELEAIKNHCINPVDSREAEAAKPETLVTKFEEPEDVKIFDGFMEMEETALQELYNSLNLAMTFKDFLHIQNYYKNEEKRNPSMTEIRVLDTYWSDHCRHTTFSTELKNVTFGEGDYKEPIEKTYEKYLEDRQVLYKDRDDKFVCLMDLALMAMKKLKSEGKLQDQEESDEINACSIVVPVDVDGKEEEWLINFKNETHNHPTEIEPFGGAATCLGGAIRDPLSGRAYVYQSMRITGAGDPRKSLDETMKGKLPQRKICQEAAHGFSSYGNQIGLTTGYVHEVYDDGFVAKRMELGAVVAAAPKDQVKRLEPLKDHIVLLIGGRTGRDGIGGATGSSKSHELKTTTTAGAEVQKGNPVEERKIQRLFRNKAVSEKIVRCNDFGAGGVCVAVGELAPGLNINLDAVLKKYEGLTGTELAISESQERMAIVIEESDEAFIKQACIDENLEVVRVATVTDNNRLTMSYLGQTIVDIDRAFLDKNGASRFQDIEVKLPDFDKTPFTNQAQTSFVETSKEVLSRLSVCGQKGLVERFDSSIGNGTVLSPFGGKTLRTETEGMAALIPVLGKETTTCSLMSHGYNPLISKWSPYHGAMYAIVESVAKIVAMGGNYHTIRFSFQEYFEKLLDVPSKWGKPFAALLGAYRVQSELKLPSIGGKDSMSGSFEDLDVPPTLVSFAITGADVKDVITPELKGAGHTLVEVMLPKDKFHVYDFDALKVQYDAVMKLMQDGKVYSSYTVKDGGVIEAVYKMAFGNAVGVELADVALETLICKDYGNIILEVEDDNVVTLDHTRIIGHTNDTHVISYQDESLSLDDAYAIYEGVLDDVYPTKEKAPTTDMMMKDCDERTVLHASKIYDEVNVVIPVFPGTNCEYDSKRAFEKAGANVQLVLIRNKTEEDIKKSVDELEAAIQKAQIIMLPGGFSAGDEPEGSGKFIATVLRNPKLKDAITDLLDNREGLMIGICNGFQALVKLGLLPYGRIKTMDKDDPTLTFNTIGRHLSQMVDTRICSVKSPWLANVNVGDIHTVPISHGEGRFVAPVEVIEELFNNGQVFTQYVDTDGKPTMESPYNPNGSLCAIEGILSADGRVIGKMAHSERQGENRNKNIYGEMDQKIFEAGVKYFKGGK